MAQPANGLDVARQLFDEDNEMDEGQQPRRQRRNDPAAEARRAARNAKKTGEHRAEKPCASVCSIVYNPNTGKMDLVPPKGQVSKDIAIFESYRQKLALSSFINTTSRDQYAKIFGTSGKRETTAKFRQDRRKAYNRLGKSEAQLEAQRKFKENAAKYKGLKKDQIPNLAGRTVAGNLKRNNYKRKQKLLAAAKRRLENAAKPKKIPVRKPRVKEAEFYPANIRNQRFRSLADDDMAEDDFI